VNGLTLTGPEGVVLYDGSAARLLALEDRYGGQGAALNAYPELAEVARVVQRIRAKIAAAALGVELRGDGAPFPEDVLAGTELAFRRLVAGPDDPDALLGAPASPGLPGPGDEDAVDEGA
jgi:hypothetical protein